ncbi:MAG: DHHA1 domain-containing protein, partial [Clostridia bacterium]|nr:DHHA1 domain-containing protein [Clostridia bacterium]
NYKIGKSSISKEDIEKLKLNISDIRLGPNHLQTIGGVDLLFTLAQTDNLIKGSFRSNKNIDTSLIAKELGGGGHKLAAGFYLEKMPLKKAEQKVLEAIKKVGIHKAN